MIKSKNIKTALIATVFLLGSATAAFATENINPKYGLPTQAQKSLVGTSMAGNENTDWMRKYETEKLKKVQREIKEKRTLISSQRVACNKNIASLQKERANALNAMFKSLREQGMSKVDIYAKAKVFKSETDAQLKSLKLSCKDSEKKVLGISTDGSVL